MTDISTLHDAFKTTISDLCKQHHMSIVHSTWAPPNSGDLAQRLTRTRLILGFGVLLVVDIAQPSTCGPRPFFNVWIDRYDHFRTRENWPEAIDSLRQWDIGNGFIHWSIYDRDDLERVLDAIKMALNVRDQKHESSVPLDWTDDDCAGFRCPCGLSRAIGVDEPYTCECGITYKLTQTTILWEVENG